VPPLRKRVGLFEQMAFDAKGNYLRSFSYPRASHLFLDALPLRSLSGIEGPGLGQALFGRLALDLANQSRFFRVGEGDEFRSPLTCMLLFI
jgi:hypothetical protein